MLGNVSGRFGAVQLIACLWAFIFAWMAPDSAISLKTGLFSLPMNVIVCGFLFAIRFPKKCKEDSFVHSAITEFPYEQTVYPKRKLVIARRIGSTCTGPKILFCTNSMHMVPSSPSSGPAVETMGAMKSMDDIHWPAMLDKDDDFYFLEEHFCRPWLLERASPQKSWDECHRFQVQNWCQLNAY